MQHARFVLLSLAAISFAACALPQRTFVASSGNDGNPCSLASPCRSFGAAVAAVTNGGEVLVLDSAGYGAVTITKSVSIIAPPGIYAGISASSVDGIIINAASIDVVLRGLTINGIGASNGITFQQGASLHVENCVVSGFSAGNGINVTAANSKLYVVDTIIRNGQAGIVLSAANIVATVSRARIEQIANEGFEVLDNVDASIEDSVITGATYNVDLYPLVAFAVSTVTIARSLISGGNYGVIAEPNAAFAYARVIIMDSTVTRTQLAGIAASTISGYPTVTAVRNQLMNNFGVALLADGTSAKLIADSNALVNNNTGMKQNNSGTIVTRQSNTVTDNTPDTSGTPFTPLGGI
jgi:hypothetical protein